MEALLITISLQLAPLPLSAQQQAAVLKVTAAALVALTAARLIEGLKSSAPAAAASAATGAAGTYPQPRSSAAAVGSEAPLLRWERRRMNSVAPSAAPRSLSSRRFQAQQRPSVTHAALGPAGAAFRVTSDVLIRHDAAQDSAVQAAPARGDPPAREKQSPYSRWHRALSAHVRCQRHWQRQRLKQDALGRQCPGAPLRRRLPVLAPAACAGSGSHLRCLWQWQEQCQCYCASAS